MTQRLRWALEELRSHADLTASGVARHLRGAACSAARSTVPRRRPDAQSPSRVSMRWRKLTPLTSKRNGAVPVRAPRGPRPTFAQLFARPS